MPIHIRSIRLVWLVVSTHLKNISQIGNLPQIEVNMKIIWNHHLVVYLSINIYGGCQKFLLLFGRIGPLALRPCALLRAWVFFATFNEYPPNSMVIWWYMVIWYVLRSPLRPLARPCIFDASISCIIMLSKSYLPRRCDWKDGFFKINPHIYMNSWCSRDI